MNFSMSVSPPSKMVPFNPSITTITPEMMILGNGEFTNVSRLANKHIGIEKLFIA